jgi:hypothetical protein
MIMSAGLIWHFAITCAVVVAAYDLPPGLISRSTIQEHTLLPPLLESEAFGGTRLRHWTFGGSAVVTDNFVRLTPAKQSREGFCFNDVAVLAPVWEARFGFRVHSPLSLGGDGFAFWVVDRALAHGGPVVGAPSAGFRGVGVVFDSFDNDGARDNPAIHIIASPAGNSRSDSFDPTSDFSHSRLATCVFDFRNSVPDDVIHAVVRYDSTSRSLKVHVESKRHSLDCANVDGIDLTQGNHYFGFTAHTGQLADNHDVYYFSVSSDDAKAPAHLEDDKAAAAAEAEHD